MYPNFLYQYAIELQRECEKELLNLTEEERLIRKAKLVTNSNGIKLPHINPYKLLRELGKRIFQPKNEDSITLHTKANCCVSCKPLQNQVCKS